LATRQKTTAHQDPAYRPQLVVLVVEVPKCECRGCAKSFEPPFALACSHHSRALARFVCELSRFMSLQDVARFTHLGWDTVKSIVKADLARRFEHVPLGGVRRIGVDENYLGKKAKYVTLVVDLDSGRVLWVGKGRGKEALVGFWERLRRSGTKIEAVACDMSGAYWSAINEHLPDAALVFDHFHIIKLANEKIDEIRRGLQRTLEITGQKFIKGTRYLLLYGRENLPPDKLPKLEEALAYNEPLSKAYYLKEELRSSGASRGRKRRRSICKSGSSKPTPQPSCRSSSWPTRCSTTPGRYSATSTIPSAAGSWRASTTRSDGSPAWPTATATWTSSTCASTPSMSQKTYSQAHGERTNFPDEPSSANAHSNA